MCYRARRAPPWATGRASPGRAPPALNSGCSAAASSELSCSATVCDDNAPRGPSSRARAGPSGPGRSGLLRRRAWCRSAPRFVASSPAGPRCDRSTNRAIQRASVSRAACISGPLVSPSGTGHQAHQIEYERARTWRAERPRRVVGSTWSRAAESLERLGQLQLLDQKPDEVVEGSRGAAIHHLVDALTPLERGSNGRVIALEKSEGPLLKPFRRARLCSLLWPRLAETSTSAFSRSSINRCVCAPSRREVGLTHATLERLHGVALRP